jgi:hypothetical protein
LSNPGPSLVSDWRFPAGNEPVSGNDVAQRLIRGLADANARGDLDLSWAKTVISNPQPGTAGAKITSVIARACDAEGFRQASWAPGEPRKIARTLQCDLSSPRHLFDAQDRFERTDKH